MASWYLHQLIAFDSVSRNSNEPVSRVVADWLAELGFVVEFTTYQDRSGVSKMNLVARRDPRSSVSPNQSVSAAHSSGLAYFCHTDTVTADRWTGPGGNPFAAVEVDDRMYGRGACDMKGSLAAMLGAIATVDASEQKYPFWIVCTADEELAFDGARHLVHASSEFARIAACDPVSIIGEPTRLQVIHAHKGIVCLKLESHGQAAHSSTIAGKNANLAMVPMLQTLLELDERCRHDLTLRNDMFDPPTLTWNFGFSDGMQTVNIVPDHCTAWASFRTMPGVNGSELVEQIQRRATELGLTLEIFPGGDPLHTDPESQCVAAMCDLAEPFIGPNRARAVCYATDGCVLGMLSQRIVCGPGDIAQAHTVDEYIEKQQLADGVELYRSAIRYWCC